MTHDGIITYKIIGGDHKEYGPATTEEVRQWILDGRVSGQTLVQVIGTGEWKPLSMLGEFGEDLKAQAVRFGAALQQTGAAPPAALPPASMPAGEPDLRIGRCLAGSARLFSANSGLIAAACVPICLLNLTRDFFPLMGPILYWFLHGVFYGGLYLLLLKRIRGEPAGLADVFAGFGPQFMQLSLAGLLILLLTTIASFACLLPGLYLMVAWIFAIPAAADKRLEFWSAMELSRRLVTRVWFKVGMLLLIAFLPMVLMHFYMLFQIFSTTYPLSNELFRPGEPIDMKKFQELTQQVAKVILPLLFTRDVVLLFNLPFAAGAVACAYEDLFGTGTTRKD